VRTTLPIPQTDDEPAWAELADWLGGVAWEREAHGVRLQSAGGVWIRAFSGDELYRDRDGNVCVLFDGRLERKYAPDLPPEAWDLHVMVRHAHGDVSQSYSVVMSLVGGKIDAAELGRQVEQFILHATRPQDVSVDIRLKPRGARSALVIPSLEELRARAGEVITLKP
jgi:hypothetical protein